MRRQRICRRAPQETRSRDYAAAAKLAWMAKDVAHSARTSLCKAGGTTRLGHPGVWLAAETPCGPKNLVIYAYKFKLTLFGSLGTRPAVQLAKPHCMTRARRHIGDGLRCPRSVGVDGLPPNALRQEGEHVPRLSTRCEKCCSLVLVGRHNHGHAPQCDPQGLAICRNKRVLLGLLVWAGSMPLCSGLCLAVAS